MFKTNHIIVQNLKPGDIITVKTRNYEYKLKVVNPKTAEVEVTSENNSFIERPTIMRVLYSLAVKEVEGSMTSPGIKIAHSLVMDKLATSMIESISLELEKK